MTTGGYIIAAMIAALGAIGGGVLSFTGARLGSRDLKNNQAALLKAQKLQADEQRRRENFEKLVAGYQAMMATLHSFPELPLPPAPMRVYTQIVEAIYTWSKDFGQALATIALFAPDLIYKHIRKWSDLAQDDARSTVRALIETGRVAAALKIDDVPGTGLDENDPMYAVVSFFKSAEHYSERVVSSSNELLEIIRRDTQLATDA